MNDQPLLANPDHWSELAGLHHWRTRAFVDHHEERIRRTQLERDLRSIAARAADLADRSKRMPCLLRTTVGEERTVYHSADAPCGRVTGKRRSIESFTRVPEDRVAYADPKWRYIFVDRCSACGWDDAARAYGRRLLDTKLRTQ
ncbi:hypothetical protein [Kitasatospora sp. CB02891]|uniref:hypothetical protein n=1 Tax=Kitasatospora sp. CB02891 TaxID=2020329 RepID=UPI000C27017D|nr:hypothetical protein [Kitasatospora sp. CB02891]PJN21645.1 hypothetical protein CG736_32325 [Kitasatospora sp. CB02891]